MINVSRNGGLFMNIKGFKINFLGDSITEGVGVVYKANC